MNINTLEIIQAGLNLFAVPVVILLWKSSIRIAVMESELKTIKEVLARLVSAVEKGTVAVEKGNRYARAHGGD